MAEIINLRRARKAKVRDAAEVKAAENRRRFGQPKADRERAKTEASLAARPLEAHRLDEPDES